MHINYYQMLPFVGALTSFILGVYVLKEGFKRKENIILGFLSLTAAYWAFTDTFGRFASYYSDALFWIKIGTLGSCLTAVLLFHFFTVLAGINRNNIMGKVIVFLYIGALFFGILENNTSLITSGLVMKKWGFAPIEGPLYDIHLIFIIMCAVGALLVNILFALKAKSIKQKKQSTILFMAILVPLAGGILTEVIPQKIGYSVAPMTTTMIAVMAFIIAYGIKKYEFFIPVSEGLKDHLNFLISKTPVIMRTMEMKNDKPVLTFISANALDILGISTENILNGPDYFDILVHEEDQGDLQTLINNVVVCGDVSGEYRIKNSNGEYRWFHDDLSIYKHSDNSVEIISSLYDVTENRIDNEELHLSNDFLEAKIKERTSELEKAVLKALEGSRAKSEFLANMSHEIRTPMNGIMGMNELLLKTRLDNIQKKYAESVASSAKSLLEILNDILDFSKVEARQLNLEYIEFNIHELFSEFGRNNAIKATEKGIEFICTLEPDVPQYFVGDPTRLRQILSNLTTNALKFTSKGEVSVIGRLVKKDEHESVLNFTISDTGIGIAEEKLERLFKAFSQADASTTRLYGGTGLGLAISKQLTELMNGELLVESRPGEGSVFTFSVTLGNGTATTVDREYNYEAIKSIKILFVDDNETNRSVVSSQIASWGIKHHTAPSAKIGLEMLHQAASTGDAYDIAILDVQMPHMDGYEMAKIIRGDKMLNTISLVMMSSTDMNDGAKRAKELGILAYLLKPVSSIELKECLCQIVTACGGRFKNKKISDNPKTSVEIDHGVKILLAEDNLTNQLVARGMLNGLGYDCDIVDTGQGAVDAVKKFEYHIVFMDIQMPVMDGFTATGIIKKTKSELPVIAMTANAMSGDKQRCLDAGMDDYISKPMDMKTFKKVIEKWISKN
ncbi:MAG: response regulator [Deltaproteobacteria bacterium]|nr:response regulator [Deltaproteobacteria bacterium]